MLCQKALKSSDVLSDGCISPLKQQLHPIFPAILHKLRTGANSCHVAKNKHRSLKNCRTKYNCRLLADLCNVVKKHRQDRNVAEKQQYSPQMDADCADVKGGRGNLGKRERVTASLEFSVEVKSAESAPNFFFLYHSPLVLQSS